MDDPDFLMRLAQQAMKMNPIAFAGNARALERFDYTGKGAEFDGTYPRIRFPNAEET